MSDHDLIKARYTISTLQAALEGASARLRELEMEVGTLNKRVALGDEHLENFRVDLQMERLRGKIADAAADAQAEAD
jgi:predicted  nucleic acid-binding Zn-ribbon protein